MGIFNKENCCLCGKPAKLLRREKLDDGNYICSACRDLCSIDAAFGRLTMEDVQAHIEEMEGDQALIADEFVETDRIRGIHDDEILLCIDGENGWWYLPFQDRPAVLEFSSIVRYRVDCSTRYLDRDERSGPGGPGGPGGYGRHDGPGRPERSGFMQALDLIDAVADVANIFLGDDDDHFRHIGPDEVITEMHLDFELDHPYINSVQIPILEYRNNHHPAAIGAAYKTARDIIDLFDRYHESFYFAGEDPNAGEEE